MNLTQPLISKELTLDELLLIAGGHSAFQLLWAGHELHVFSILSKHSGLSKNKLIRKIGLHDHPGKILLTGLVALRLIIVENGEYRNSTIAEKICVADSKESMIEVLGWQKHIVYPGLMNFTECLRQNKNLGLNNFKGQGDSLYERLTHNPKLEKIFQNSMQSLSKSANKMLVNMVDFSGISHLVDAGGGDGTNAIEIARANPTMKVTIFDSPSICKIANTNIQKSKMLNQVNTHAGNFFVDEIPSGVDCVLFCHIMTIWSLEKDTQLLRKVYNQLPVGGKVMIFNMMGNDTEDGPIVAALGSPYFLAIATGEGGLHSWKDYEEALSNAGFQQTQRLVLPKDHGVLVGIKNS